MSQVMSTIKQFASKLNHNIKHKHKPGESTSSRPGWMVRDSQPTIGGLRMTNTTAGTFTGLILFIAFFCLPALLLGANVSATASNIGITISGSPSVDIKSTPGGTFADSGNSTITVTTNHASGYTLTAKAVNATSLAGTKGGNLATLDSGTAINADTFSNASNTQYNDKWGYKPSKYNSIDNTTSSTSFYYPSPGLDTASSPLDTLDTTTNSSSSPYTYTVSIGARVSTATAIDNYSNSFVFAVVGNPTPYAITYNKNTTDTVSNMPANHTTSDTGAAGESVTLASNTPTRTGYSFNGWCTVVPTTSGGIDSCSGTRYTAGGTWTINQTSTTNSLYLYAMWNRNSYNVKVNFAGSGVSSVSFTASGYTTRTVSSSGGTASLMYGVQYTTTMNFSSGNEFSSWALNSSSYGTLSSTSTNPTYFTPNTSSNSAIITATGKASCQTVVSGTMQAFKPCSSIAIGTAGTLTDSRDSQSYKVVKLADGKWWMAENLNLAGGTALSSANTDVTDAYINSFTTRNNLTKNGNTIILPASSTSGFKTNNYSYVYNSGNKTNCGALNQNTPCYSYYSWDAVTLGSGRSISTDNANAPQSICPKGWKLPSTYNGSGTAAAATDFRALMISYGGSNSIQDYTSSTNPTGATMYSRIGPGSTPNFLLAGFYDYGSFGYGGSRGRYWSSTSYSSTNYARFFNFGSANVNSANTDYRYVGASVRCLFSE